MDHVIPDDILQELLTMVNDRYMVQSDNSQNSYLKSLFPGTGDNVRFLRLKRKNSETACWKTLLFVFDVDQRIVPQCFSWAASVQEELLNNESSDLYLFLIPKNSDKMPIENCIYIESNDQFCRKYVMRPDETFLDLINRTFLYQSLLNSQIAEISDPLITALEKTGNNLASFTPEEQNIWKNILLSGTQGIDTAEALIQASIENSNNDKA